jgi:hypothetical protein
MSNLIKKHSYEIFLIYNISSFLNSFCPLKHWQQVIELGAKKVTIQYVGNHHRMKRENNVYLIRITCDLPPQSIEAYTKILNLNTDILGYSISNQLFNISRWY